MRAFKFIVVVNSEREHVRGADVIATAITRAARTLFRRTAYAAMFNANCHNKVQPVASSLPCRRRSLLPNGSIEIENKFT